MLVLDTPGDRVGLLTSELQGLSVTVGSLERQLLDREAMCDGLRRELAAVEGGDRGQRESELARQVEGYCMQILDIGTNARTAPHLEDFNTPILFLYKY